MCLWHAEIFYFDSILFSLSLSLSLQLSDFDFVHVWVIIFFLLLADVFPPKLFRWRFFFSWFLLWPDLAPVCLSVCPACPCPSHSFILVLFLYALDFFHTEPMLMFSYSIFFVCLLLFGPFYNSFLDFWFRHWNVLNTHTHTHFTIWPIPS